MPNTRPPVATAELFQEKLDLVGGKSYVDFGLYGMLDHDNADQIGAMADLGAMGFKLFMGQTTGDNRCPNDAAIFLGSKRPRPPTSSSECTPRTTTCCASSVTDCGPPAGAIRARTWRGGPRS